MMSVMRDWWAFAMTVAVTMLIWQFLP